MQVINTSGTTSVAGVKTKEDDTTTTQDSTATDGEFDTFMKGILSPDGENNVSEEDLFASLIEQRVTKLKGEAAGKSYHDLLTSAKEATKRPDGRYQVEDAARAALKQLVQKGDITAEEGDKIHSEAFDAAQLDDNKSALYDGIGGKNDPTKAVAALEAALLSARLKIESFDTGAETAGTHSLNTTVSNTVKGGGSGTTVGVTSTGPVPGDATPVTPNGTTVDGADGFLFKPESNNSGKLAVLLPASFTGNIDSILLKDENGNEIERGQFSSVNTEEGNRAKFNFGKPGSQYPKNITVEVKLSDGSTRSYVIPDPSKRYD